MSLSSKHILDLQSLPREDIELILDTAEGQKEILDRTVKKVPILRGKSICTFFIENSTRTKCSFEIAAKMLSADVTSVSKVGSSLNKGESFKDTLLTLEAMGVDMFIIRHSASGSPYYATKIVKSHIVNAGDGMHAHPTQGLLDLLSIRERMGVIEGLTVLIVGDIYHSRVARSDIWGLAKMGARVRVCAPETLIPAELKRFPCEIYTDLKKAAAGADVINMLRVQTERMHSGFFSGTREYNYFYGLDSGILEDYAPKAVVMHPAPINRGVEIASEVADSSRSIIVRQVTNGVAVRMAILYLLLGHQE
ncbi:MAG: aspartate carbamoyltransferase catalytic subunit [Abditibacteriota bacterium]|nr:aspartate carbamoyltransferase catalytic subunit [Abditibacteriota bacterium]